MSESGEINDVKKKAALGGLKVSFSSDTSNDDGSGEDSRHSSDDGSHSGDDGSRSSHKDSGSTVLVDILQWADHFEPWLSWLQLDGTARLECGEPAAEAGELIRRQLSNSFGDFFNFHVAQYNTR
jgi:hypothetical protein